MDAEAWLLMRNEGEKYVVGMRALGSLETEAASGENNQRDIPHGARLTRRVAVHVHSCSCSDEASA